MTALYSAITFLRKYCADARELEARATPGPWHQAFEKGKPTNMFCIYGHLRSEIIDDNRPGEREEDGVAECSDGPHDAGFVVSSRNSYLPLVEFVEGMLDFIYKDFGYYSRVEVWARYNKAAVELLLRTAHRLGWKEDV